MAGASPYGGAIPPDEVVPHLTVAHLANEAAEALTARLERGLPIFIHWDEAWLMTSREGRWIHAATFPLGGCDR